MGTCLQIVYSDASDTYAVHIKSNPTHTYHSCHGPLTCCHIQAAWFLTLAWWNPLTSAHHTGLLQTI